MSSLDAWEKKQDELNWNISDASIGLEEALMARATHMLNEPVVCGPDFYGKSTVRPVVTGKKRDRKHVQMYIVRKRKRQEEIDEEIEDPTGATMVDH